MLQDYTYLKSLERKHTAPKKLDKKLHLPDLIVCQAIELLFQKTKENKFEKIYGRPLGWRCFQSFLCGDENNKNNPVFGEMAHFILVMKALAPAEAANAVKQTQQIKKDFFTSVNLVASNVWVPELLELVSEKLENIKDITAENKVPAPFINMRAYFAPLEDKVVEYLEQQAWPLFLQSSWWQKYCQFKHLELNMKIEEADFDVHRILGRGGFGEVYGCRKVDTGAMFAMKKLDKKRLALKHQESTAVHERNVLAEMNSKFVTNLKYAFHDAQTLYLILDLCEGGDLSFHLKLKGTFSNDIAKFYAAQIILGLAHIHARQMIYRDLKPANILLDGVGNARISDLGLVRDISKTNPTSECGTQGYMAPEVITEGVEYGLSADWWSLGCMIFQLLVGYTPFRGPASKMSSDELNRNVLTKDPVYPDHVTPSARELISGLLIKDGKIRLGAAKGAAEIRALTWFQEIDWHALIEGEIAPPYVPIAGQVNAKDVYDIEQFDDYETRKITVTPEDNAKYYKHFDHIMSYQWQEEVLVLYDTIVSTALKNEAAVKKKIEKSSQGASKDSEPDMGPATLEGYILYKGTGFMASYQRRFMQLFRTGLVMREEQLGKITKTLLFSDIKLIADTIMGPPENPNAIKIETSKAYSLLAEHPSDYRQWLIEIMTLWDKSKRGHAPSSIASDMSASASLYQS